MLSKFTPLRNSLLIFCSFGGDRVYDISSLLLTPCLTLSLKLTLYRDDELLR